MGAVPSTVEEGGEEARGRGGGGGDEGGGIDKGGARDARGHGSVCVRVWAGGKKAFGGGLQARGRTTQSADYGKAGREGREPDTQGSVGREERRGREQESSKGGRERTRGAMGERTGGK